MSTRDEPGPFDGLERALPGEPVFTLRAHDPLAADLVRLWVDRRRRAVMAADLSEAKEEAELVQATEAERIAWAMVAWRDGRAQAAETPAEPVQPVAGTVTDPDELAAKAEFDTLRDAARRLDNAVAEICAAADSVAAYAAVHRTLDPALDAIRATADALRPKRTSYAHRG